MNISINHPWPGAYWRALRILFLILAVGPVSFAAARADEANRGAVRIVFGGDVMLDRNPGHALAHGEDPFADVAPLLKSADLAVCNLECVVARHGQQLLKPYTFKARPACLAALQQHFGAVNVANNHSGDYGPEALLEEFTLLEKACLPYFGGGRNKKEAHRPLIVQRNGRRIALLGYNEFPPRSFEAGAHRAGTAGLFRPTPSRTSRPRGTIGHADFVIPMLHWGDELEPSPNDSQKVLARSLIDAGADAVIGGAPAHFANGRYLQGPADHLQLGKLRLRL